MSDKAKMQVQTTIPLVAIILGCLATGKIMSDVSHMRDMMEVNSAQMRNVIEQVENLRDRVSRVEAFMGINPKSDGIRK